MTKLDSYKQRLSLKTIKELKSIYVRLTGIDLLRGTKREMIITLASFLDSRRRWDSMVK